MVLPDVTEQLIDFATSKLVAYKNKKRMWYNGGG